MNNPFFQIGSFILLFCGISAVFAEAASVPPVFVAPTEENASLQADMTRVMEWVKKNSQPVILAPPKNQEPPFVSPEPVQPVALIESPPMSYSKSQAMMLDSLPKTKVDQQSDSAQAFDAMVQQSMPLSPRQVVQLRQLIDQSQRAAVIPATIPPKPVSSTMIINLAPGTTPPAIRLAQGYVTSLVFVDSAGSPWPIASYDLGNAKATSIQWDGKGNVLLIQATQPYGDSDVVIRLVGLATPVTLELVSGQRVVDYRTDIHVPGFGPNSKNLPIGTGVPSSASPILLSVLDGVAPSGSTQLIVRGDSDCLAWMLGDRMYLRTRMTVLSPGWTGRMVSPDGMIAYEMGMSSSVLVSRYGEPIELKIEGL